MINRNFPYSTSLYYPCLSPCLLARLSHACHRFRCLKTTSSSSKVSVQVTVQTNALAGSKKAQRATLMQRTIWVCATTQSDTRPRRRRMIKKTVVWLSPFWKETVANQYELKETYFGQRGLDKDRDTLTDRRCNHGKYSGIARPNRHQPRCDAGLQRKKDMKVQWPMRSSNITAIIRNFLSLQRN